MDPSSTPSSTPSGQEAHEKGDKQSHEGKKPNHLKGQTSPYLLQHLYNPVDWHPWGKEALALAKKENKPIFLSVGYSACHWCHVMEHESFEDKAIAKLLNANFVCIKVDREERPDIDALYMAYVQGATGSGGWPMSVVLTPEGKPWWGGTYFPPRGRAGMLGFEGIMQQLAKAWKEKEADIRKSAEKAVNYLERVNEIKPGPGGSKLGDMLGLAVTMGKQRFDEEYGGFGQPPRFAPKFPHATELTLYLRYGTRIGDPTVLKLATKTLDEMAQGGIYDQLGGGFHRYSVDRLWNVPHFEKMLYDNSQLAMLYMEGWQATGKAFYRQISEETLRYVRKEMTSPEGGFYSTTDADSEGEEGVFFVWTPAQIKAVLGEGERTRMALAWYGVTESGNFEGRNTLTNRYGMERMVKDFGKSAAEIQKTLEGIRSELYAAREKRVHPHLDDKVLASWNGLMLSAFARAGMIFANQEYLATARRNADFLLTKMSREDGRLYRTRRDGHSHLDAFLEDYAFVTQGLLDLFEATGESRWLSEAKRLHGILRKHFARPGGSWFTTSDDHEKLLLRDSSIQESSLPSGQGVAAMNAARMGLMDADYRLMGEGRNAIEIHSGLLSHYPLASCQLLLVADLFESKPAETFLFGKAGDASYDEMYRSVATYFPPYRVLIPVAEGETKSLLALLPSMKGKSALEGKATAWVCYAGTCKAPITDPKELLKEFTKNALPHKPSASQPAGGPAKDKDRDAGRHPDRDGSEHKE